MKTKDIKEELIKRIQVLETLILQEKTNQYEKDKWFNNHLKKNLREYKSDLKTII